MTSESANQFHVMPEARRSQPLTTVSGMLKEKPATPILFGKGWDRRRPRRHGAASLRAENQTPAAKRNDGAVQ